MHIDKGVIGRLADVSLFIPPNQPVLTLKDLQLQGWQRESMLVEPSLWYVQASYKHDTILPSKALCCGRFKSSLWDHVITHCYLYYL